MVPPAYLGNPSWTHNLASSWRPCQSYLSWEFWRKRKRASSPVYWDKQGSHNQQVSQMTKEMKMSISQQNTPIERKNTPECEHNRGAKLWKSHNRNTKHQEALRQIYRGEQIKMCGSIQRTGLKMSKDLTAFTGSCTCFASGLQLFQNWWGHLGTQGGLQEGFKDRGPGLGWSSWVPSNSEYSMIGLLPEAAFVLTFHLFYVQRLCTFLKTLRIQTYKPKS